MLGERPSTSFDDPAYGGCEDDEEAEDRRLKPRRQVDEYRDDREYSADDGGDVLGVGRRGWDERLACGRGWSPQMQIGRAWRRSRWRHALLRIGGGANRLDPWRVKQRCTK